MLIYAKSNASILNQMAIVHKASDDPSRIKKLRRANAEEENAAASSSSDRKHTIDDGVYRAVQHTDIRQVLAHELAVAQTADCSTAPSRHHVTTDTNADETIHVCA